MPRILLFASGSGTNAQNIAEYFKESSEIKIDGLICNKKTAGVIKRMEKLEIPVKLIKREDFEENGSLHQYLKASNPDLIVLAGFLWLIPEWMVRTFPERIVNIHPALLPKYGGKGMYGSRVHEAVCENKEKESGISIHYVNERYDEGGIIFQATCQIDPQDGPAEVASKVHDLEYKHFPRVIESILLERSSD